MRIIFNPVFLLTGLIFAVFTAFTLESIARPPDGAVSHVVIAWLKKPGNQRSREKFIEVTKSFANLPGVVNQSAGVSLPGERAVVDSSFDVAAIITFESRTALQNYLHHPRHKKAVHEILEPLVRKLIVYDMEIR